MQLASLVAQQTVAEFVRIPSSYELGYGPQTTPRPKDLRRESYRVIQAQRHRGGVGDVVWFGKFQQFQFRLDRVLHLFLGSFSTAGQQFLTSAGV